MKINIPVFKRHKTINALFKAFGEFVPEGMSKDEFFKTIECQKIWGFISKNTVIHFWAAESVDFGTVLHFVSHEMAHANSVHKIKDEENRAEAFAMLCIIANDMSKRICHKAK